MAKKSSNKTGKVNPIWPSKTPGKKSGKGRGSNPPKPKPAPPKKK